MDTFRWLQPAPLARGDKPHEPPEPSVAQKQTRQRHADADWEQIREYLVELLYVYDLKDAAKIIKDTRGFDAGQVPDHLQSSNRSDLISKASIL